MLLPSSHSFHAHGLWLQTGWHWQDWLCRLSQVLCLHKVPQALPSFWQGRQHVLMQNGWLGWKRFPALNLACNVQGVCLPCCRCTPPCTVTHVCWFPLTVFDLLNNARRGGWHFDDNACSLVTHWPGKASGLATYINTTCPFAMFLRLWASQ